MTRLSYEELQLPDDPATEAQVGVWLARGDGIAVYENQDLGHPDLGHRQFASFGSPEAMFPDAPPERLPDFPGQINWRYSLVGTYQLHGQASQVERSEA